MNITDSIAYIGVNDHELDLFEGQYIVPNGMAYNSYVVMGEKIAVMDSVEERFGAEWLGNLAGAIDGRAPDFLVVQHMEPDHSANITRFMDAYQDARIVASAKAFEMLERFYGTTYADRRIVVKEGDELAFHTENMSGDVSKAGEKWWENDKFMNWQKTVNGESKSQIERRQGLVDRSKTPFWLVNNADYELVQ